MFLFHEMSLPRQLQGKRRQEVIEKWLKGEEDPDWMVKPTKTEGKYIISPRRAQNVGESNENSEQKLEQEPDPEQEPQQEQNIATKPIPPKAKPKLPKVYPRQPLPIQNNDLSMEILAELKALGEYKRQKEARKLQKKEIKKQIRKHAPPPPALKH
jgi:hypothetical protein